MALLSPAGHPEEQRARPPEVPAPTPELLRARVEAEALRRKGEALERRGMVRGLLVLAAVVLLLSMERAGWGRVFVAGWWRQW